MVMTKYQKLLLKLDGILKTYVRDRDYVIRISDGEDFFKIMATGTDRADISPKPWEPLSATNIGAGIKHEDVIIASSYEDLVDDTGIENGTLKHKLETIKYPLVVCYRRSALDLFYAGPKWDLQNYGAHYLFKHEKLSALILVFSAKVFDDRIELFKLESVKA